MLAGRWSLPVWPSSPSAGPPPGIPHLSAGDRPPTCDGAKFGLSARTIADRLSGVSYAELEEFALDVQRRSILSGPEPDSHAVTQQLLKQWSARADVSEQ